MIIYANNRSPKKLREQRKKKMARKAEEYNEWLNNINSIKTNFSRGKKVNIDNRLSVLSPKVYVRETPKYNSLETIGGVATKPVMGNVYTGDKMLGIGTLHKSNAVPIFNVEDALDQAKMRR
jgi:hypothetical protein